MKEILRKNKLPLIVGLAYLGLVLMRKDMAFEALSNSAYYLVEMAQILPVIFMLTVAIDVLIPKEWIIKRLGSQSGLWGPALALAFGSLSAGPIYAAFPIAKTLHKKGASVSNVVIILSAWAVIKVPMLANEAKFLGPKFMVVRWFLTVVFIIGMGFVMEKSGIKIKDSGSTIDYKGSAQTSETFNINVKEAYCIGCSICEREMPYVFEMSGGKARIKVQPLSENPISPNVSREGSSMTRRDLELLESLMEKCPGHAISIQ